MDTQQVTAQPIQLPLPDVVCPMCGTPTPDHRAEAIRQRRGTTIVEHVGFICENCGAQVRAARTRNIGIVRN